MSEREQRLRTDDLASTQPARDQSEPAAAPSETYPAAKVDESGETSANSAASDQTSLMALGKAEDYRRRWDAIQTNFVDAPRDAVAEADELVAEVMRHLAETFAREREDLERSWEHGEDISTEDLRVSLQRYRSFFNRLLGT